MCLALPGCVVETRGAELERSARVSFAGTLKDVSLAFVPEAVVGDYVLVHAGFAIARIDEKKARALFEEIGVEIEP